MSAMEDIMYEVKQRVALITLCRSEKRNALSFSMIDKLWRTLRDIRNEPKAKVVLIKAEGPVFCAGADLKEMREIQEDTLEENIANSNRWRDLFQVLYAFPKMVIAQVDGPAIGGGCGLVSACDFVLATPESTFACSEAQIGFIPAIVMFFIIQRVGEGWAKEILLRGKTLSSERALQMGLVNKIVPKDELFERSKDFAQELIKNNSYFSMETTKQMIQRLRGMPMEEALKYASEMNANARLSDECKEGVASFVEEKEKMDWTFR